MVHSTPLHSVWYLWIVQICCHLWLWQIEIDPTNVFLIWRYIFAPIYVLIHEMKPDRKTALLCTFDSTYLGKSAADDSPAWLLFHCLPGLNMSSFLPRNSLRARWIRIWQDPLSDTTVDQPFSKSLVCLRRLFNRMRPHWSLISGLSLGLTSSASLPICRLLPEYYLADTSSYRVLRYMRTSTDNSVQFDSVGSLLWDTPCRDLLHNFADPMGSLWHL